MNYPTKKFMLVNLITAICRANEVILYNKNTSTDDILNYETHLYFQI